MADENELMTNGLEVLSGLKVTKGASGVSSGWSSRPWTKKSYVSLIFEVARVTALMYFQLVVVPSVAAADDVQGDGAMREAAKRAKGGEAARRVRQSVVSPVELVDDEEGMAKTQL